MKLLVTYIFVIFNFFSFSQTDDYTKFVNPFIGTGGHGHTYPGATIPFGFMQLSPDTRLDGWDGCGGYHYSDSVIFGFSHTHLSGTGVSDLGDVLVMPFNGPNTWTSTSDKKGYGSKFSHKNETAYAGYYSVLLEKSNINVQLTTTAHSGFHEYKFSDFKERKIIIDLEHRDELLDSKISFINDSTLVGRRISKAWAKEQHIYFTIQLSESPLKIHKSDIDSKLILEFSDQTPLIKVKVGISAVDIDGALNNLSKEIPHWNFDSTLKESKLKWNTELSKINIETSNINDKKTFYTALYHSFIAPNIFSDVDGRYRGMDMKIHNSTINQYTVFSLWDTFRATHPLYTITQREKTLNFINTFLNQYKQGGILPIWELNANYTHCMIGYHTIPVIVDAYVKGIKDFDTDLALEAMVYSANQNKLGLDAYKSKGFIGSKDEPESVSKTLEYAYDDWCIAVFADSIGNSKTANEFYRRSAYYKNLYNPESKFMEPKFNGGFKSTFRPDEVTFDYTEANAWQYSLFAPHDINGLINLIGGKDSLELWLDNLFTTSSETVGRHQVDITGLIGQYAHGNEPSHHMAYLYNYTNHPQKTQHYRNQILNQLYSNTPEGLSGNEDCGQMSAWYVLSSMGIYSVTPGSDIYEIGVPLFNHSHINLENGKTFNIIANSISKSNCYVKSVLLNGQKLNTPQITHTQLMNGGTLSFEMTDTLIKQYTNSSQNGIISKQFIVPYLKNSKSTFTKKTHIELVNPNIDSPYSGEIYYQKSDSVIQKYLKPIKLKDSETITSWIQVPNEVKTRFRKNKSHNVVSQHKKVNHKWEIKLNSKPHPQYKGESDNELIDKQNGGTDFRTGKWQGFYAQDMSVEINLNKKTKINSISTNFTQDIRSWIWYPENVSYYYSNNGTDWTLIEIVKNEIPIDDYNNSIQKLTTNQQFKARYIKVVAKNRGVCPEWHLGKGNTTFIFADEIEIE
jgi:predicted alpha-1,2-mannosidase